MFEFIVEMINFLTFSQTVEAAGFAPGGSGSGASILSTGLNMVVTKIISLALLIVIFIVLILLAFTFLAETGFLGVRASSVAHQMRARLFTGIPIFGIVMGMGAAFVTAFINRVSISEENRNNIKCILVDKYCSSKAKFNTEASKFDYNVATLVMVMNITSGVIIALAIIGFITSGLMYTSSAANPKRVEDAKRLFLSSGAGIIVAISLFTIARLLTGAFM